MQTEEKKEISPLEKHIAFFANQEGKINFNSIRNGQKSVGDNAFVACCKAAAVMAVGGKIVKGSRFTSFTPKEGLKLIHPCDSKIFTVDGHINEEFWTQLVKNCAKSKDEQFIRQDDLMKYMANVCHKRDKANPEFKFWARLSKGEWEDLFVKCANYWDKTPTDADYVPCITVSLMRQFFENTPAVFDQCKQKLLPIPKPTH